MRRMKYQVLQKVARRAENRVISNYGPVTVEEAEFRRATDTTNCIQNEVEEQKRLQKKETKAENTAVTQWYRRFKAVINASIKMWFGLVKSAEGKA